MATDISKREVGSTEGRPHESDRLARTIVRSDEELDTEIERIAARMVVLVADHVADDERVEALYVYAGLKVPESFAAFYRLAGELHTLLTVDTALNKPDHVPARWERVIGVGTRLAHELGQLFVDNAEEVPDEMRLFFERGEFQAGFFSGTNPDPNVTGAAAWEKSLRAGAHPFPPEQD